jgi:hypothetical protein
MPPVHEEQRANDDDGREPDDELDCGLNRFGPHQHVVRRRDHVPVLPISDEV